MAEIAENLHRREITSLERAELRSRWTDIRKVGHVGPPKGGRQPNDAGIGLASRELNIPKSTLKQSVRIASLSPGA